MDYRQNLFNSIKMMLLTVIFVETAVMKMIITPSCIYEYIAVRACIEMYLEHIILSIIFLSLGGLIFLKEA